MHDPVSLAGVLTDPAHRAARGWEPFRDGIEISWLYRDAEDGPAAAFLRYAPGAVVPEHEHMGYEHILVLEGAQTDEYGEHAVGALVINPPGTRHSVHSPGGCLVLAIWERPVRFVAA